MEASTKAWSCVHDMEAPLCRGGPTTPIDPSLCLACRKASPAGQAEELHAPVEDLSISQVLRRKRCPGALTVRGPVGRPEKCSKVLGGPWQGPQ